MPAPELSNPRDRASLPFCRTLATMSPNGWTAYGVSDQEAWDIYCAARCVGRTYIDDHGAHFTVSAVADCRPSPIGGAAVIGTRVYPSGNTYHAVGSWVGALGEEITP
jgi:hypothetical protein